MAQYLKDDVREGIIAAAIRVFARRGYQDATMAEIAKGARVSTGNIYRYFENKDILFDAAVPQQFVESFNRLLRRRVTSLRGTEDIRSLPPSAAYHLASEDLLQFCISNRLRIVILLGRCQGSRYEDFAEETVQELVRLAVAHLRSIRRGAILTETLRFNLVRIYKNLVASMVETLATFENESTIRETVGVYTKYHLSGLTSLFA
jgi:AcrR family transcriptional regulator